MDKFGNILELETEGSMEGEFCLLGLCHRWKIVFLAKIGEGDLGKWRVWGKSMSFVLFLLS